MSNRTTDVQIMHKVNELTRVMREAGIIKPDTTLTLHQGSNGAVKTNNYLLIGKTNVWPMGVGGRTKTDAWNAMQIMIATLSLAVEVKQDGKPIA
jgi:hypothetical protein